jgi:hypothetical protein
MNEIIESNKTRMRLSSLIVFLILVLLVFTPQPVRAQTPFDLSWSFDYSPLVSGASSSLQLRIRNTGLARARLLSAGVRFPWMEAHTYVSTGSINAVFSAGQEAQYRFSFDISPEVLTGKYIMETLLQYQVYQATEWSGPESTVYLLTVIVLGRSSSYTMLFNPADGRFYSALALLTLVGWYLPKKLRPKAKG